MNYKNPLLFLFVFVLFSCGSPKPIVFKLNTEMNFKYKKSRKTFVGKLDQKEFIEIKTSIENEIKTKIPMDKPILIHYFQKGENCISASFSDSYFIGTLENCQEISLRICKRYNALDFFIYTKDSFHEKIFQKNKKLILDSGFFKANFFTLQENCEAFFILKPSGDFMKFYGEDYFTEVSDFLYQEN